MEGPKRPFDIPLGDSEVVTIDLDNLDADPADLLAALEDARCPVWYWTKLAAEHWRAGARQSRDDDRAKALDTAERIGNKARELFEREPASLPLVYALLCNLSLARARHAPKLILDNPKADDLRAERTKEACVDAAAQLLNRADRASADAGATSPLLSYLTRGITHLAAFRLDEALRAFDGVLAKHPTNLVALVGKARVLYARRQFPRALQLFQHVLQLAPDSLPDPRVGIGLCFWALDQKQKARAAWQRSVEVHPDDWPAKVLLGLDALNASRDDSLTDGTRASLLKGAAKHLDGAFRANARCAAAANALCQLTLRQQKAGMATKLAERAVQCADTRTLLADAHARAGRLAALAGDAAAAERAFTQALAAQPSAVAAIGLAQVQIKADLFVSAAHTLEKLLDAPGAPKSLEATAMLASLKAHARPGVPSAEVARDRARARELFDGVAKALDGLAAGDAPAGGGPRPARWLAEDADMHAEVARLWQGESPARARRALEAGVALGGNAPDARLANNLGVLAQLAGDAAGARALFEGALTAAAGAGAEGTQTTLLYNLARAYEASGDATRAREAYVRLLARHPEYVDAKVRCAALALRAGRREDAHALLKEALTSAPGALELRAAYTHFLLNTGQLRAAKDFVWQTLKAHAKHDVYALCATGWIQYHQAREARDPSPGAIARRREGFQRAAEFYEKALALDARCAVAAQGLAIITAEDALGTLGGALPPGPQPDDAVRRGVNARAALDVLGKVRESLDDGAVYVNMGHCYFARDEFDRAIESYETASKRYYNGENVPALLCLTRAWYAKANKDQSFAAISTALAHARAAALLAPADSSITYNVAMLEQKAAELLFAVPPAKRSLPDLTAAIEQASHAQQLFAQLAADPAPALPYNRELADQRRKYGESMLRKGDDQLAAQRTYEDGARARLDAARARRAAEKDRQAAADAAVASAQAAEAEALAERRRREREADAVVLRAVDAESDEERTRKAERAAKRASRKAREDGESGGEDAAGGEQPSRRKRRKKVKEEDGGAEEALFSADEGGEKPKKRGTKKRVVKDEDDEETAGPPRKKQIKSKEVIEDSDEEMGD